MKDGETKPMTPGGIDIEEVASRNPHIDVAKVREALGAVQLIAAQGVAMAQFDLILPFTRVRPGRQRQPKK